MSMADLYAMPVAVGGCVCTKWLPLQMQCMLVDTSSVKMDVRRLEIIDKLNSKSSVSDNGQCIMWTGCCKGRGVRYGVMCANVSLHGPGVWRRVAVHRLALALMKTPHKLQLERCPNRTRGR